MEIAEHCPDCKALTYVITHSGKQCGRCGFEMLCRPEALPDGFEDKSCEDNPRFNDKCKRLSGCAKLL